MVVGEPLELPLPMELLGNEDALQKVDSGQVRKDVVYVEFKRMAVYKQLVIRFYGHEHRTYGSLAPGKYIKCKGKTLNITSRVQFPDHGFKKFSIQFRTGFQSRTNTGLESRIVIGRTPGAIQFRKERD